MRVIQGAVADIRSIQPSAAQAVLALSPPGAPQGEPEAPGPGPGALLQGQDRLHQEGRAALLTLSCSRAALRDAMQRELQEQKEVREHGRAFFRSVSHDGGSQRHPQPEVTPPPPPPPPPAPCVPPS